VFHVELPTILQGVACLGNQTANQNDGLQAMANKYLVIDVESKSGP
jgi:hypothetical protein